MSKVAEYLQEHLLGEVTSSAETRRHLAHDASILQMAPAIVAYPRNEDDIRKILRFSWQLAERGRKLPVVARGGGSDTSGAAITDGILVMTKAHMNRILALDPRKPFVTVEPGLTFDKLQQALYTHGLFLPPEPASGAYATLGGSLANNTVGPSSHKYGNMSKYVQNLRVALANGELIETKNLTHRELNHKMGLSTLEGNIYRALDALIEENHEIIERLKKYEGPAYNAIGYNLAAVKVKNHLDLTPLFIGSKGTLGIITEATLGLETHQPAVALAIVSLNSTQALQELLPRILGLKPSRVDFMNRAAIEQIGRINPPQLTSSLEVRSAEVHLFVEFDSPKDSERKKCLKNLQKIAEKTDAYCHGTDNAEAQETLLKIRESVSTILTESHGQAKAVPVAEDIHVPPARLAEFIDQASNILRASEIVPAMWGDAASGIIRLHPILDIAEVGDRQKLFKLADQLYPLAVNLGGSITAGAGDGRVRAPYARGVMGEEVYGLMVKLKNIFDPYNILNPGVKFASVDDIKALMRSGYSNVHRHEHLPRS